MLLNSSKEKNVLNENRRLSFPSIIDDLFNDISIRENLKRKYSADKILPRSGIFHIKQGHTKSFHENQPKTLHYNDQQRNFQSEKILSLFSKGKKIENPTVRFIRFFCIFYSSCFSFARVLNSVEQEKDK